MWHGVSGVNYSRGDPDKKKVAFLVEIFFEKGVSKPALLKKFNNF